MSDASTSYSGERCITIDELQKMEKRLLTFIKEIIQPTRRSISATPIEAKNSWQEDEPSPFSVDILNDQMPPNFAEPLLDSYTGRSDPFYHIAQFESAISLKNLTGSQKCRLLYTTLKETALQWFSNLPVGSITTYTDFKKLLLDRFVSARKRLRGPESLFDLIQGPTESLQSYADRFLQATMDIRDFTPTVAQVALTHGLRDEAFRYLLKISPPQSFDEMLDMLNCHMNKWANDSMLSVDNISPFEEEEKQHPHCDKPWEESGSSQKFCGVYVNGFGKSSKLDEIKRKLEEHFGSCGKITDVIVPERSGVSKGFGFIDFEDYNSLSNALKLNNSVLGDRILTVQVQQTPRRPKRTDGSSAPRPYYLGFWGARNGAVTTEELSPKESSPEVQIKGHKKYKVTGLSGIVYTDSE